MADWRQISFGEQRRHADRVQADGSSVQVWEPFHSGAKSPLVRLNRYLTGELYRGILWNTLLIRQAAFRG